MFSRRNKPQENQRPAVKKVSELINTKSHNQKKYISLMLVPSYSNGKTRSLRIPRAVLYGFAICMILVFSVVSGLYLRSMYFESDARNLSNSLDETQAAFNAYQQEAELAQSELIDATMQMYEELSGEQARSQREIDRQEQRHQDTLENIWDIIDTLEEQILEFEEKQQEVISNLGARSAIPPIANLLSQMEESHMNLRRDLSIKVEDDEPTIALMAFAPEPQISGNELMGRLNFLVNELEIQRQILDSFEDYKSQMQPYLLNYPTMWPVRGKVSSGFGWRRNPFGGSGSEFHGGVDIPARAGTPIRAAGGGTVTFVGWRNGYGNTVEIDHGDGVTSKYAHNSRNNVAEGRRIERGDIIAYVGSTGRSTGAHLHFEVHQRGVAVNPIPFLVD